VLGQQQSKPILQHWSIANIDLLKTPPYISHVLQIANDESSGRNRP